MHFKGGSRDHSRVSHFTFYEGKKDQLEVLKFGGRQSLLAPRTEPPLPLPFYESLQN